jgi:hypothetical protein
MQGSVSSVLCLLLMTQHPPDPNSVYLKKEAACFPETPEQAYYTTLWQTVISETHTLKSWKFTYSWQWIIFSRILFELRQKKKSSFIQAYHRTSMMSQVSTAALFKSYFNIIFLLKYKSLKIRSYNFCFCSTVHFDKYQSFFDQQMHTLLT